MGKEVVGAMKQLIAVAVIMPIWVSLAQADTYRWLDDKGVVHFTDDPDRIPPRYLKRVQEIPADPSSIRQDNAPMPLTAPPSQAGSGSILPGGLPEQAWRSRFTTIRSEMKALQDGLTTKRDALDQLRRKRIIYQRSQDRLAYSEQSAEIERDEVRIRDLEAQLNALENEASRAGVPLEWRR